MTFVNPKGNTDHEMATRSIPFGNAVQRKRGRNRQLVLGALEHAEKPMGAYELLDALRESGLRSPPQVYRALDQLIEGGSVHKIESLNAYALCSDAHRGVEGHAVFTICTRCRQATEAHEPALARLLARFARRQRFRMTATTVEMSGLCETCADT